MDYCLPRLGCIRSFPQTLEDLLSIARIAPLVNQIECPSLLTQGAVRRFCRSHAIQVEAWSPLIRGNLEHPVLHEIAHRHGRPPAQVVLRWDLQICIVTTSKSATLDRISENADIFAFELTPEEMGHIDDSDEDRRFGPDPDGSISSCSRGRCGPPRGRPAFVFRD